MKYRPVRPAKDIPAIQLIEDAQIGVTFDYMFMGSPMGKDGVNLLIQTVVMDSEENRFTRKTEHLLLRNQVKDCIKTRIEEHLIDVGVDKVQIRGLLRFFEVNNEKCRPYDASAFIRF